MVEVGEHKKLKPLLTNVGTEEAQLEGGELP